MKKTKQSLYYVFTYLTIGGILFGFFPKLGLKLFFSTSDYSGIWVQLVGGFMLALAIVVIQIIRKNLIEQLYMTTIIVRLFLVGFLFFVYFLSSDPMFLILIGIVLVGVFLTLFTYRSEQKASNS